MAKGKKKGSKKAQKKQKDTSSPATVGDESAFMNGAAAKNGSVNGVTLPNGAVAKPANGTVAGVDPRSTKLPDKSKQKAIVKQLTKQADQLGLQVGDKRFIISAKWWERWCQFVSYDDDSASSSGTLVNAAPSKINNMPLLHISSDTKLDELMGGPLRSQLKENYHYVLLPQEVWDALLCWYGGGPTIARFVMEVGDPTLGNSFKQVQVYPEQADIEADALVAPGEKIKVNASSQSGKMSPSGVKSSVQRKPVPASPLIPKICGACRSTTGPLKRCGSCQLIWYCGAACQTSHWKYHKTVCRSATSSEDKEAMIQEGSAEERRGKMGLRNLGNTCFMNSALQCLSHVEILTSYFLSNQYQKDLNKDNPLGTGGNLATEYDALLKELWFGTSPSFAPAGLKRAIGRFAPQFSGFQQHDSQELLAYLLDGLHEDLNRVKQKPYTEVKESDGKVEDAVVAKEAWERHLLRNNSIFVDHVQGQFKSTVVCPICAKVSITFDPFNCIQLELPMQQNRKIEVVLVPSEAGKQMTRYWVEVSKRGSMLGLKKALAKLCGIPASNLLAADIYQSMTYRIIGDNERLVRLRDEDRILMYQVETSASSTEEVLPVRYGFLYHRIESTLIGDPLLFTFDANTTCLEILQKWSKLIGAHVAQTFDAKIPPQVLAPCVYLTDRDGAFLRREPIPADNNTRFLDYAMLQQEDETENLVFATITWSSSLLSSSASPRPDLEKIVNHETMKAKEANGLSSHDGISLDDCFRNFTKTETLDQANLWYCSKCKEHRQARKTMEIWKLPDVLILSLKRFEYRNEILRDKLDVFVDFPMENLDMTKYCLEKTHTDGHLIYDLFAVSNHYGGMGFGHYTAFAKSWQNGNGERYPGWYSFDDSHVTPAMAGQVKSNAAYILFYKRRNIGTSVQK
uniref:Ubiquitin carboxyl-terminal hydrolase n=1 Tax=Globisporangium ultimum (strain ATCC 200006 / CBS 805.95 / DAOM BR144) TaxID=431595 RepID=K3WVW9_GLOUD